MKHHLRTTWCATLAMALIAFSACDQPVAPSPAPPAPPPAKPVAALGAPEAPPPPGTVPASQPAANEPIITIGNTSGQYSKEELENIIQHLDWHGENFASKFERPPKSIEELKAWKDPNYPLGMKEWPKPPPGKKWVMNPQSAQFSLADDK
ncbi:MAG: hypothetical protein AB1705_05005 [Verrucomicrobiota bacterium]